MILGIGVDLVALPALAGQVGLPGSTFLTSVLTARERRAVESRARTEGGAPGDPHALAPHVGARWAAKEAFVKAWSAALGGTAPPITPEDLVWREIEVVQDHWGRPTLVLHGRVAREVALTLGAAPPDADVGRAPGGSVAGLHWHLSLSHDGDCAVAVVLLERRPAGCPDDTAGEGSVPGTADPAGAGSAGSAAEILTASLAEELTGTPATGRVSGGRDR